MLDTILAQYSMYNAETNLGSRPCVRPTDRPTIDQRGRKNVKPDDYDERKKKKKDLNLVLKCSQQTGLVSFIIPTNVLC